MENYGQIHNEMIGGIMKNVRLSAEMTADQKKEIVLQGFVDTYGKDNADLFAQGLNFNSPFEIVDSIKGRISGEFDTVLREDIDYLLKNDNVDYKEFLNKRFEEVKLDEKEMQLYKDTSSILLSSVELWSSEEGSGYLDLLDSTTESVTRRPPTREQVVGYIGVQDWVGGVFGGILGGPLGVAVGAAGASVSATIGHLFYSHYN
ncbi:MULTISPECIES: hypothetical protein [Chryseobacterium]|jgi:hypothetical protein|uniref:Uncharacterized protein n=1 Tax=Chryseobacterium gambrini TaxID=373672 RepID=A0AAJ1VMB0_9FLAO|nr:MULTISPECIES: hypothetical protein [Chryseobacterium]MDN4012544.1 hypothetical protein [Chryseobacterium gambrini]QWA37295.1 hypothetical protein KKI44_15320 [Chryseobacterium sp. ZHDP1]QWA37296.1 hypothetical protein KKI44_15325 [Chryseobacterium sp. ZHDP1]QWA37297.1 hypothetical protein KKI44_15330 [Chryseobacterium sp. ZHDP1]